MVSTPRGNVPVKSLPDGFDACNPVAIMRAHSREDFLVLHRIFLTIASLCIVAGAQAQDLTDEQRAEIAARIAPVGDVCLQGENCGGLPAGAAPAMAAAPAPAPAPAAAASPEAAGADTEAPVVAVAVAGVDGEAVYNQACLACHASGVGGAPVVGDVDSWAPRIAKGIDSLHSSGLNGVAGTAMMAKGGRMDLSDAEVIAAVDYMVSSSQ